jgi:hypothetical protein
MSPDRIRCFLILFVLLGLPAMFPFSSPASAAFITFNDGATHVIDHDAFAFDNITVTDGPSSPTIVNIVVGAEIGGTVAVFGTSEVHFSGGTAGVAAPGCIGDLESYDSSLATLSGGNITCNLVGRGNGTILVSGGLIANGIHAEENSTIVIDGTGFNHPYGEIEDSIGFLSGVLRNGTPIENQFFRHPGASLVLVPEPSTALLFGFGLIALASRHRRPIAGQ